MIMKRLVVLILLFSASVHIKAADRDSLLVMFWNIENFFDWTDQGTGESDNEFSSRGKRAWTRAKFYAKCDAIAKSMMWISDSYGRMPDAVGLAEVENRRALSRLVNYTLLRKYGYGIVHYDSKDKRGIDVALLYRKKVMRPRSITLKAPAEMSTRDILHVEMGLEDGSVVDMLVNHHPSKLGGAEESHHKRITAMKTMKSICDSLNAEGRTDIVAMGDFNDTPDGSQFEMMNYILDNKGLPLYDAGLGTIRYKGRWELIDNFLTSPSVCASDMEVVKIPFLMTYDKRYPGEQPFRTYSGPKYIGGVSDHCPVLIWILAAN